MDSNRPSSTRNDEHGVLALRESAVSGKAQSQPQVHPVITAGALRQLKGSRLVRFRDSGFRPFRVF